MYPIEYNENDPIYYDTETVGLGGLPILLQYAVGDGPIVLWEIWKNPIIKTLELIEWMMNHPGGVIGFNLTFDHFMLCKIYTLLSLYPDYDALPEDIIEELAELESRARDVDLCLKPVKVLDLFLHARKGPYQSTMDRKNIKIKRVPTGIAFQLARELETRVILNDIYFARRKKELVEKWVVEDCKDEEGKVSNDFKNITLRFAPSIALKVLAGDALGFEKDDILKFSDIEVPRKFWPVELLYAPFCTAISNRELGWKAQIIKNKKKVKGYAWPAVIQQHIDHWSYNAAARKYAELDVVYTRDLYKFFKCPEMNDDDSILTCAIAAIRWRGFKVDLEKLKELKANVIKTSNAAPKAPGNVKKYILPFMTPEEKLISKGSTKKVVLEALVKNSKIDCPLCFNSEGEGEANPSCLNCQGTGEIPSEAAKRARAVLDARTATKEIELFDKILKAGRFHASFKIIGALSGRMSGADGLNPQGIKNEKSVRKCFTLAWEGFQLCGGDFESFEITIAEAIYKDPKLREDLTTPVECLKCHAVPGKVETCKECSGTGMMTLKIHGLFAQVLWPEEDYESILATKGTGEELDKYTKGKKGVFASIYGGNAFTLQTRLGVSEETAEEAVKRWQLKYPGIKIAQKRVNDMFNSMRQPSGIGSRVYWHTPADYMPTLLGFNRYFTLENMICKALFDLGENPPKEWEKVKVKVIRRDREQTSTGATRSALFGAAFALQSANVRAATNHEVQGTGAGITKKLQRNLWVIQPTGVHPFNLMLMNIHDEIMAPTKPNYINQVNQIVKDTVESFRPIVPLIGIDWGCELNNWSDK